MTTDKSSWHKLITDLKSVPSRVFYIFAAVAFFCCFFVLGISFYAAFVTLFLLALVACAAADVNSGIVPDLLVLFIALLGVIDILLFDGVSSVVDHIIGAVCVAAPMLVLSLLVKGAFGGGDIKLVSAAGLFLGWRLVAAGVFLGMFVSGFYAMYLLILHKAGSKSKIKLAPFLAIGLSLAVLFGDLLIRFISIT